MNPKNDLLTNLPTENTAPQSLPWHGGMIGMMLFCILLLSITGCVTTLDPNATPAAVATPDAAIPRPGLGSLGDPYYPWMGNSGYDAMHYTIDLTVDSVAPDSVDPPTTTISSTVTMEATALQPLSTFNLDFLGFAIDQLTVNGTPATFSRTERELLIIPATPLAWGEPFSVTVAYQGVPEPVPDPALGIAGVGWLTTPGGIYVFSQPSGASSWFPVNDYPQDKASYTFRVTVPEPYTVVANGILQETTTDAGQSTYLWEATDPMASYLATINIGKFARQTDTGPNGLPIRNYFPIDASAAITLPFAATAEQLAFFSERFGPYPFAVYGSLVMAVDFPAALETQTIPIYGRSIVGAQGERVLAHEMAHQWIGDYVSVETWQDIWINEGFATYADWLWVEESQGEAAMQALIRDAYRLFATPNPQEEFPKQPLVARLQSLPLEGLTLAPEQVAIVLNAFLGTTVATDELDAAVADLPAAGLPGTELPALIDEIPFDVATFSPQQLVTALETLELDEIAASVVVAYPPPGAPPINQLFGASVYERGGLTFAALHARLGDETFFAVMRTYIERYGGGVAGTDELIGVAEAVSGQELTDFFHGWLFAEELPDIPELGLIRDDPTTWQEPVTQEQE